jgi:pimeloyl-ACP methyl ester carboxylesterase
MVSIKVNETKPQFEIVQEGTAEWISPQFLTQFFPLGEGSAARQIAYLIRGGRGGVENRPGLVWLGGVRSNMRSIKASFLDQYAAEAGRAYLRFDYSGHGESGGDFKDATIGMWLEESLVLLRRLTNGPQILIGSSMGGWLALLAARALAASGELERLAGLVLIAPATDFTQKLIWDAMPMEARATMREKGVWLRPSRYAPEPDPITARLIEEGRNHLLLDAGTIRTHCPVHILQGMQDEDVPWRHAMVLVEHLHGDPVTLALVKDGDHRLSRDEDLARLRAAVEGMG